MIDHVSIGVRDLPRAVLYYDSLLAVLGFQRLVERETTVGFGKTYPEFWLNARPEKRLPHSDDGCHICLRAPNTRVVDDFFAAAMALGATESGLPGYRPEYHASYYACFVKDPDENHIEVVTFVQEGAAAG